jgi:hypothetical protein
MARYTDIDNLIKIIQDQIIDTNPNDLGYKVLTQFIAALNHAPIADVAPRAEVAREIFEEIEKTADACIESEWLRGSWFNMSKFKESLAELKNKYAEGEK